ncbi:MAG: hypothetical protein HZC43_07530 [Nitrosomonadales bacterium]|nr:hypothetical protein [Nitrosomonadales bacterium]
MGSRKLLVEGEGDQDFFQKYCELLGLVGVDVFPPKNIDPSTGNGWSNLVNNLPILLSQIKAGDIDKLGIVLDADYPPDNNGGFSKRRQLVTDELVKIGYNIPKHPTTNSGEIFAHPDGLPSVGLWVMPNHQSDGMLEGFIENMVSNDIQISLLNHAEQSINKLPMMLFDKKLHQTKAKVFTWRAWQKRPGIPLNKALLDGLLDRSKSGNFENWLLQVFK